MEYKFKVSEIEVLDLEGRDLVLDIEKQNGKSLTKIIGNVIYCQCEDLDLVEKAKSVHKGDEVSITEAEKVIIDRIINTLSLSPIVKRAIFASIVLVK